VDHRLVFVSDPFLFDDMVLLGARDLAVPRPLT
jgi:hypothetical protein